MKTHPYHCSILTFLLLTVCLLSSAQADVFEDVPEAEGYELVYAIDLPAKGNFFANGVPYEVDNRDQWNGNFDRIAYYLRLVKADEEPQFIFVSGNTFTRSGTELGFPLHGLGFFHQAHFRDITVVSNVEGIVTGERLDGGYVEMWPGDYTTSNSARVPNASGAVYDFGDSRRDGRGYGCFQIHNFEARQTLFAFNRWNDGTHADLGIGNNTIPGRGNVHPDWTFRSNANEYVERRLEVLVRPGFPPPPETVELTAPVPCSVVQRQPGNEGAVFFSGLSTVAADEIVWRLEPQQGEEPGEWQPFGGLEDDLTFEGHISLPAGWHAVQVRTLDGGIPVGQTTIREVGVGEVFIIAGQSNSANHGRPALIPTDPRVCATDGETWQLAADPQPIATGNGGSPWPAMGDRLVERFDVPVGIMSVGWGGTSVEQWLPGNPRNLFPRLQNATDFFGENGVRAILWHQGESNAARRTSAEVYERDLSALIASIRRHAGWEVPWGVARASYLPRALAVGMANVIEGQNSVIANVANVFAGPETNDLTGEDWRWDNVHFNEAGLREHGRRWAETIDPPQCQGFPNVVDIIPCDDPADPDAGVPDAGIPADAGLIADASGAPLDAELPDANHADRGLADDAGVDQGLPDAAPNPLQDAFVDSDAALTGDASIESDATALDALVVSDAGDLVDGRVVDADTPTPQDDGSIVDMANATPDQSQADAGSMEDIAMAAEDAAADTATNDVDQTTAESDGGLASGDAGSSESSDGGCDCSSTQSSRSNQLLVGAAVLLLGLRRRRRSAQQSRRP